MNQYERIVSYLYRYEHGEKRENSGYAKVERREKECRVSIQGKLFMPVKDARAYFYIQEPSGIRTVEIGQMQAGRNEMHLKKKTETDDLFGSGKSLEDVDGIFIYAGLTVCYATTWKNDYFYQGDWRQEEAQAETSGKKQIPDVVDKRQDPDDADKRQAPDAVDKTQSAEIPDGTKVQGRNGQNEGQENRTEQRRAGAEEAEKKELPVFVEGNEALQEQKTAERELKMQSVCEECLLKKETSAGIYGERILRTLPTMYPFKDVERGCCVKMELQDIGCLPMRFWPLSGNRFLLHGYYCYRHLLFLKGEQETYFLGVPGIYNEKEFINSIKYGFSSFRPIGGEKRQGAFGYWMMKLE